MKRAVIGTAALAALVYLAYLGYAPGPTEISSSTDGDVMIHVDVAINGGDLFVDLADATTTTRDGGG